MTRRQAVILRRNPLTWFVVARDGCVQIYTREGGRQVRSLEAELRHRNSAAPAPALVPVKEGAWGSSRKEDMQWQAKPRNIADYLNTAWQKKAFDRMVIIASATVAHEIKHHLHAKVRKTVAAEMAQMARAV